MPFPDNNPKNAAFRTSLSRMALMCRYHPGKAEVLAGQAWAMRAAEIVELGLAKNDGSIIYQAGWDE